VPRDNALSTFEGIIFHLYFDTCHSMDWATCPLLEFCHMMLDPTVQRLGTPEELGQELLFITCLEALKSRVNPHHPSGGDT
jgi:hypothetical protein